MQQHKFAVHKNIKILNENMHTCYTCGVKFMPKKSSYGEPEEVMTTLYEYGCKPICYACYFSLRKPNMFQRFFNYLWRRWSVR